MFYDYYWVIHTFLLNITQYYFIAQNGELN